MKVIKIFASSIGICVCSVFTISAQKTVQVQGSERLFIGKSLEYFVDSTQHLGLQDIMGKTFIACQSEILNLGNTPYKIWIRFSLVSKKDKESLLEINAPLLSKLEVYQITGDSSRLVFNGGFLKPFHERPVYSENWLFNLHLEAGTVSTIYMMGQSIYPFQIPIVLSSENKFVEANQFHNLFWGIYMGVMIFAFIYNFFVYLSVRERSYLYYLLYVISSVGFYLGLEGFGFQLLWPDSPGFNPIFPILVSFSNCFLTVFTLRFLRINKDQKALFYWGWTSNIIFILLAILNIAGVYELALGLSQLFSLLVCIFYITAGIVSLRRGVSTAKYYLIGWSAFLLLIILFILALNNVVPSNFFTTHGIFIGHMTEVLLLSFALADRINVLKTENEKKQKEIIIQLEENHQLQTKVNRELEQKVEERTAELKHSLENLKSTQSQLIQSEKMASLGELTAGIAHEIQNPLNFMNNFSELNVELLDELRQEMKNGNTSDADSIAEIVRENELKISNHGKRADAIVKGMLQHSRSNTGVKEAVDINSLVDEYLRLSYNGLRAKEKDFNATIKTDFDITIGKINLIPQDIARMLLNLYNNAFYFVSEKKKTAGAVYEPTVSISTKKTGNKVEIRVKDNGKGIPPKVVDKIFQPFFTTKPAGQGTGLGLSISYDIVKAHGGEIKVETKEGDFTEFVVHLPISA
jgi:signal transduction histidine kinase